MRWVFLACVQVCILLSPSGSPTFHNMKSTVISITNIPCTPMVLSFCSRIRSSIPSIDLTFCYNSNMPLVTLSYHFQLFLLYFRK